MNLYKIKLILNSNYNKNKIKKKNITIIKCRIQ